MSWTKNLLRLDKKCIKKLVTVARKPCRGVAGVSVDKLAEWNFNLLVYYVKLCELKIRTVVMSDINDNSLRSIEDHQNLATPHDNT